MGTATFVVMTLAGADPATMLLVVAGFNLMILVLRQVWRRQFESQGNLISTLVPFVLLVIGAALLIDPLTSVKLKNRSFNQAPARKSLGGVFSLLKPGLGTVEDSFY